MTLPFDPIAEAHRQWEAHDLGAADVMAAVTSVVRAHQLLLARLNELLEPFDLTFARYEVLQLLAFTRAGELPLGTIGERLMVHPASVTNAVDRLEAAGLVERRPHPTDGRAVLARLTAAGRQVVETATVRLVDERFAAAGLDDAAARDITALLRRLRVAAGDFEDPGPG